MTFKYQKAWERYASAHPDAGDRNLYDFLEGLEGDALTACMEDILTKQIGHLREMFPKMHDRFVSTEDQFLDDLMDAPLSLIKETLSCALDELFYKALDGDYSSSNKTKVLRRIYAITAKNGAGLSSQAILDVTEFRNNLDDTLRLELLMLLSKLDNRGDDYTFWQQIRQQIPQRPYLGAAVVDAFKDEHAWDMLDVLLDYNEGPLARYRPSPEHLVYFESALEAAIFSCLKNPLPERIERFVGWKKKVGALWVVNLLDDILGHPSFVHIRRKVQEEEQRIKAKGGQVEAEPHHSVEKNGDRLPTGRSADVAVPAGLSDERADWFRKIQGSGSPNELHGLFESLKSSSN